MYGISQNPFYLYFVHRTSVSGERSRANGPLVSESRTKQFRDPTDMAHREPLENIVGKGENADKQHFINISILFTLNLSFAFFFFHLDKSKLC